MSHAYNGTVLDNLTWTFDPLGRAATFGGRRARFKHNEGGGSLDPVITSHKN